MGICVLLVNLTNCPLEMPVPDLYFLHLIFVSWGSLLVSVKVVLGNSGCGSFQDKWIDSGACTCTHCVLCVLCMLHTLKSEIAQTHPIQI